MPKVFISHAWEDNEISRKLARQLRRDGVEIWIYYTQIEMGDRLPEVFRKAIEWCDTFMLIWSESTAKSSCVKLELQNALYQKKTIVTCLFNETKQLIRHRNSLHVNFSDFNQGYENLIQLLNLDINEELQQEILSDENETISEPITIPTRFREKPEKLSEDEVGTMIKKYDFFDLKRNEKGCGIDNQLEIQEVNGDKVIFDHLSGLIWQCGGSTFSMWYDEAKNWLKDLNDNGYSGYNDWRLPTLEEAMCLMNNEKKSNGLYIDPLFDNKQLGIWTSDLSKNANRAWVVFFNYGTCYINCLDFNNYVRPVRSGI